MKTLTVKANEVIFRKGEKSDSMFLIKSGKVGIYANYGKTNETEIAMLGSGKFFGEMGIIEGQPRSADVVARSKSELLEVSAKDFTSFVENNTADVVSMMENLSKSLRKTTKDYKKASKTVEMYVESGEKSQAKAQAKLENIAKESKSIFGRSKRTVSEPKTEYAAGEILFKQGEKGSCMFQILEGSAVFYLNYGKADQKELATAKKGEIFGEMSVIEEEKRSATVVAKTALKVRTVANSQLSSFLAAHPDDAVKILRNISAKLRNTTEKYVDILATISDFVTEEEAKMHDYVNWSDFVSYAEQYNAFMAYDRYNPFLYY